MKDKINPDELPFFHDQIDGNHGYTVPEGYFETLPDLLVERLRDELDVTNRTPEKTGKIVSLWARKPLVKWVAAAVVLLVLGIFTILPNPSSNQELAMVDDEAILEYLLSEEIELEEEDLVLLPLSGVDIDYEISDEAIEEYLEDIDLQELEDIVQETL